VSGKSGIVPGSPAENRSSVERASPSAALHQLHRLFLVTYSPAEALLTGRILQILCQLKLQLGLRWNVFAAAVNT